MYYQRRMKGITERLPDMRPGQATPLGCEMEGSIMASGWFVVRYVFIGFVYFYLSFL